MKDKKLFKILLIYCLQSNGQQVKSTKLKDLVRQVEKQINKEEMKRQNNLFNKVDKAAKDAKEHQKELENCYADEL